MDGQLFVYGPVKEGGCNGLVAMRSGNEWRENAVVHVAGLTDGLLSCPWAVKVSDALANEGWCFVQPILNSSYLGYGLKCLEDDVNDLDLLFATLVVHGVRKVLLVGHSTGCQDIVKLLAKGVHHELIKGAVYIGPVSDREYYQSLPNYTELLSTAKERQGTDELMPRSTDEAAICPERLLSLAEKGGDDDLFSSDYTNDELQTLLFPCTKVPSLIVMSLKDEYVPSHVDISAQASRLSTAMLSTPPLLLDDNHTIVSDASHAKLCAAVRSFAESCKG
eukprot:TRINITY_DN19303_c0_g1_i1.p1 TRINITY_DN19303_c0_g1~~TRINITY_DN19303_c0_g1_i1.p1  ORF type:complete len:278 (+),score=61.31 TRINITY_DN19303_c0_g1_i1:48-881(+)